MFPEDTLVVTGIHFAVTIAAVIVIPFAVIIAAVIVIPFEGIVTAVTGIPFAVKGMAVTVMVITGVTAMACIGVMVSRVTRAACISIISSVLTIGLMEVTIGGINRAAVITGAMGIQDIKGVATGEFVYGPYLFPDHKY